MPDIQHVTAAELSVVVRAFRALQWPLSASRVDALVDGLGWTRHEDGPLGVFYLTGLSHGSAIAEMQIRRRQITEITVPVSAMVDTSDPVYLSALNSLHLLLVDLVSRDLGRPAGQRWRRPAIHWELDNSSRVWLRRQPCITLTVVHPGYAAVERREEALGEAEAPASLDELALRMVPRDLALEHAEKLLVDLGDEDVIA